MKLIEELGHHLKVPRALTARMQIRTFYSDVRHSRRVIRTPFHDEFLEPALHEPPRDAVRGWAVGRVGEPGRDSPVEHCPCCIGVAATTTGYGVLV